jgi:uncharacterized protein
MRLSGFIGAAALMVAAIQSGASEAQVMDAKPNATGPIVTISVTEFEEAMPDIATVSAGVDAVSADASKALDEANKKMQNLMVAIKAAKLDPKDVQTSGVNVGEEFDYTSGDRESKGYRAANIVSLKVRDLSKLKTLMSALVAAGATTLNGPNFGVDDEDVLTDKARMRAFDTAKRRATAYAMKAGFKSVKLQMVSEGADYSGIEYAAAAAADASAGGAADAMKAVVDTPVEPGLIQRSVAATFQFEMIP